MAEAKANMDAVAAETVMAETVVAKTMMVVSTEAVMVMATPSHRVGGRQNQIRQCEDSK
jgi:hypothetical protein